MYVFYLSYFIMCPPEACVLQENSSILYSFFYYIYFFSF